MNNYRLKNKYLSGDEVFDGELHLFLKHFNQSVDTQNGMVYDKQLPNYTPFARALFSLLLELTNPHGTAKSYCVEKLGLLFEDDNFVSEVN